MVISFFSVALMWWCFLSTVSSECEVGLPPVPSDFRGSSSRPGEQIIAEGLSFNRSASIKCIHLGGTCSMKRCFGEFQVWRPVNQSAFSLLHTYLVTVQPTATTYFSTSVPIRGTPLSVESGDVVGFLALNNDAQSEGIGIVTSSTSDTRYTLFEFNPLVKTAVIDAATSTRTQVIPLISAEACSSPGGVDPDSTNSNTPAPNNSPTGIIIGAIVGVIVIIIVLVVVTAVIVGVKVKRNKSSHSTTPLGAQEDDQYASLYSKTSQPHQYETRSGIFGAATTTTQNGVLDTRYHNVDASLPNTMHNPSAVDIHTYGEITSPSVVVNQLEVSTPIYGIVPSKVEREGLMAKDPVYHQIDPDYNYATVGTGEESQPFSKFYEFESDDTAVYCPPSNVEEEIYSQMHHWNFPEIPRQYLTTSTLLGEGQFGEVYAGKLQSHNGTMLKVAVKLVKKGAPDEERTKFLQEAAILGQFKHKHVVKLLGMVTVGEPKMMVMEMLPNGDLRKYLERLSANPCELSSPDLPSLLLQFCKQVVDGLASLARKSFVHRDIAARNILLDKDLNCKISDFGMTRDLESEQYYIVGKGRQIPVKWTAPEALMYKKYSTSSDVWSYGMLMYEIWSVGHKPFEKKNLQQVVACFHNNYCHPPPPGCPRAVYEVMVKCWNPSHNERPSASDIGGEFCKSERILLSWKKEDIVSPSAQVLGGPLLNGEGLYKDLQFLYRPSDISSL